MNAQPHVVMVDVDNTIADTQVAILNYIAERTGERIAPDYFSPDVWGRRDLPISRYVTDFLRSPGLVGKVSPSAGASAALQRLHEAGYEMEAVSSRMMPLREVTTDWLQQHGFTEYFRSVHNRTAQSSARFKQEVASKERFEAAFEDDPANAIALAEVVPLVYLINQPWNVGLNHQRITRQGSFAEAVDHLLTTH